MQLVMMRDQLECIDRTVRYHRDRCWIAVGVPKRRPDVNLTHQGRRYRDTLLYGTDANQRHHTARYGSFNSQLYARFRPRALDTNVWRSTKQRMNALP